MTDEVAGVEFAGLENDGRSRRGGICRTGKVSSKQECIRLLLFYSVIFQSVIFQSVIFQSCKFQSPDLIYDRHIVFASHSRSRQISRRLRSSDTPFLLHKPIPELTLPTAVSVALLLQSGIRLAMTLSAVLVLLYLSPTLKTFLFRQTFRPSRFKS